MTKKEKDAVARAIASALRDAPLPGVPDDRLEPVREEVAMHLGDALAEFLDTDAERMGVLFGVAGWDVEVRHG